MNLKIQEQVYGGRKLINGMHYVLWGLVIEGNRAVDGPIAIVRSSWSIPFYEPELKILSIDLPYLTAPDTVGNSSPDTLMAQEMAHLLNAQKIYIGHQVGGDPDRDMTLLTDGLAGFIYGTDNRVNSLNNSFGNTPLVNSAGDGRNGGSDYYAGACLTVKYLDKQTQASGSAAVNRVNAIDEVEHLNTWMKGQRDANAGAPINRLNQYIVTHLSGVHGYGVDDFTDTSGQVKGDFLADYDSIDIQTFINGLDFTDKRTVSVHGGELGCDEKPTTDVVRDDTACLTGFNSQLTYTEEESSEPIAIFIKGDGGESILNPTSTISFGDTNTCNIENARPATQTLEYIHDLLESVANPSSAVGSNMEVIQNNLDLLLSRNTYLQKSISRTQDTVLAKETAGLARTEILLQMNLSMDVPARETSRSLILRQ